MNSKWKIVLSIDLMSKLRFFKGTEYLLEVENFL